MLVFLTSFAQKQMDKLEDKVRNRIKTKIHQLTKFPYVHLDIKKIKGLNNIYRLRVGDYRVLFEVNYNTDTIKIFNIEHRNKVYKRK